MKKDNHTKETPTTVTLDDASIERLVKALTPMIFTAARVASWNAARLTSREDFNGLFATITEEAATALRIYQSSKEVK